MVPVELLKTAVEQLPKWNVSAVTRLTSVNWRQGYQIKMHWYDGAAFICYLDFKRDYNAREAVLKRAFEQFADDGAKPRTIDGHGWTKLDYEFRSGSFISVNEIAQIAQSMGYDFTVLYVQESISSRPIFSVMGIPLVPGEMGKEWVDGEFVPYSCPMGQNL
ncbi:hypothetical protein [Pseudomonas aeruginosa]|uniref:hypothetical protein n=1 Tax=Pseudomonas aeruginosa TaxID=287 RepID=UPI0034E067B5